MNIKNNIADFQKNLQGSNCRLIAVSKTKPIELIMEAYEAGQRIFGENKVQELVGKYEALPKDIAWHMIGHLQRNKVKYIAPFVQLIHSVDSLKLLKEINKEGMKNDRVINCLLQVYIADEATKFGLSKEEVVDLINSEVFSTLGNIKIVGLMGMATNTDNKDQIRSEFNTLKNTFEALKDLRTMDQIEWSEISMGMSGDYALAIEEGSTLVRVGSAIFGARNYQV
jgi:pyridoxal phosphate enzyme (YggS family)